MRKSQFSKKQKTAVVGTTVAALMVGGVAFAYWTNTGSGAGSASTGTNSSILVNQTTSVAAMAPGVAPQALSGNFTNANSGPVYVHEVTAIVTGTDKSGCTASDYTIAGTALVNAEVPAGTAVGSWTGLTIQFNNKPDVNQDACKNATVALAYASN